MTPRRSHEWAWGAVGRRTVCGLGAGSGISSNLDRLAVVVDLGALPAGERCRNCERMRAAIGASRVPPEPAPSPELAEAAAGAAARVELAAGDLEIMAHATAWGSRWPLHRNHFCAGPGHADWSAIAALVARGLMKVSREPSPLSGGDTVFSVTAIGIAALRRANRRAHAGEHGVTG